MSRQVGVALAAATAVLLAASAACGGGTASGPGSPGESGPSAGGTPLPAGQAAKVDPWRAAQTWLVDRAPVIEPGEVQDANAWRVTLVHAAPCSLAAEAGPAPPTEPPAPPAEPPALPGEPTPTGEPSPTPRASPLTDPTHYCVLLMIENPAASPGLLDLGPDGPTLVGVDGARLPVAGARMETGPFVMATWAGRMTSASNCSFSAPDAQGRQAADCAMVLVARSNGTTFEEALAAIGAGKAVELELAFPAPEAGADEVLEWPGGVRFAAGPSAVNSPGPPAEGS